MRVYLVILIWLTCMASFSQSVHVAPAPDALGLAKLANIPVNHYTGSQAINIPLAQVGGNEISVPISLLYNASGHKVQEMAGSVGLGWNLQAGGMITRIVRGLPDDATNGYCKPSPSDTEPDLYFFNFLGQSGKFVLDKFGRAITMPYRDIVITPGICLSGSNGTWQIIDESGYIYKFGQTTNSRETTTSTSSSGTQSFTSTWFLSQIISPNSTETVQFSYTTAQFSSTSYFYRKQKDPCNNDVISNLTATITTNTRYISTITAPMGTAFFQYSSGRMDVPGALSLTSLAINNISSQQVKKHRFEYDYFKAEGCTSSDCFRLRLDRIFDLAPDPMYSFFYNTDVNLPSRYSKNFDHWGYYNSNTVDSWFPLITYEYTLPYYIISGPSNYTIGGASREPDPIRSAANILTGIEERGGSCKRFEYEAHVAVHSGAAQIVGGVRIKKIEIADGMGSTFTQSYNYTIEGNPNLTSGLLFKKPKYMIAYIDPDPYRYVLFSHSFNQIYDTEGVNVGYSRVEEQIPSSGKIIYTFTNFDSHPNQPDANNYVSDFSWKRGKLIETKVISESGTILSSQLNEYDFDLTDKKTLKWKQVFPWGWSCSGNPGVILDPSLGYTSISRPVLLKKQTKKIFDPQNSTKFTTQVSEYEYDLTTLLPIQIKTYDLSRPSIKYITKNRYVNNNDYLGSYDNCLEEYNTCMTICESEPDPQIQGNCYIDCGNQYSSCLEAPPTNLDAASLSIRKLRDRHQIAIPVETINLFQNGSNIKTLSSSLNIFQQIGASGNHIQLKEVWAMRQLVDESSYTYSNVQQNGSFQFDSRYKKIETYDLYDQSTGNLKRKTNVNGLVTDYQWESNNKYLQSVTLNPGPNARTTSYTYKPMVGHTSVIDPNNVAINYEYDVYNRLKLIKDYDGNILTRYRYHYKNETPGFRVTANRLEAFINETFTFYATDVAVSTGETPTYTWDFGDGVVQNGGSNINHAYVSQGQYIVKLTLTNSEYGSVTRTLTVSVSAPMSLSVCVDGPALIDVCGIEPVYYGGCTVNNNYPYAPTNLTVTVTNGCQSSLSYYWEYRNTSYSYWTSLGTSQSVDFYPPYQEGTYEVKCTVTDACNDQKTTSTYIWVYKSDPNCPGGIQH